MKTKEDAEREAAEVIVDLVCQYAYPHGEEYFAGGFSVLEDAFEWLIEHGYATGNASHIKLTDKAENKAMGDELGGDLYTTWEGREDE